MKSKNSSENFILSLVESFLNEQIEDDEKLKNPTQNVPSVNAPIKDLEKNPIKKDADNTPEVPDQEFVSALEEDLDRCNELDPFWDEI